MSKTEEVTAHISLIPVSDLESGSIQVEVKPQINEETKALDWGQWANIIVCKSFVFKVSEGGSDATH